MRAIRNLVFIFTCSTALYLLNACHKPAPDSGFLKHASLLKEDSELPFDATWIKDGVDLNRYKKIYIADINTDHLLKMSWWDKLTFARISEGLVPQDQVKLLASFFKENLINSFSKESPHKFILVKTPDQETLIIELAIVEVVPTKIWLNSLSYLIAGALDTGSTAIEGRFRDGKTNEVLFRFKDKSAGPYSLVNIKDFTWYSHSKVTMEKWSRTIVAVCNRNPGESLSSPINFTLLPW